MADDKQGADANEFIKQYGPLAEKIGTELKVDPKIILGKFGLETNWGKNIIPGTYNLGNIKDPSGRGVRAYDKKEKSNDAYLKFEDPEAFAEYYSDFIKRMYPNSVGAGSDVDKFTEGLSTGRAGKYATAENYGPAVRNAYSLVNARVAAMDKDEYPFGKGPTEAEIIKKEESEKPPSSEKKEEPAKTTSDAAQLNATLGGAGLGLLAGKVSQESKLPAPPRLEAARERFMTAQDRLRELQARASTMPSVDLENELKIRQAAANKAADELRIAQDELKALSKAPTAPSAASVAEEVVPRKVAGSSGAANWARVMADEIPDVIAESATSMRKADTTGAQALIDRDVAARQRLQQMGLSDYKLSGSGQTQLALPADVAAERAAAMESELARKQAQDAAERARIAQQEEAARIAAQKRVEAARIARQQTGEARKVAEQTMRQAQSAESALGKAQADVGVAKSALARAQQAQPGAFARVGEMTGKVLPKTLGVISGAATGMSAYEAIDRYKKGDTRGAVLPTIEATLGVMSMLPPAHPVLAALRGIGMLGGAGLAAYQGYRALKD